MNYEVKYFWGLFCCQAEPWNPLLGPKIKTSDNKKPNPYGYAQSCQKHQNCSDVSLRYPILSPQTFCKKLPKFGKKGAQQEGFGCVKCLGLTEYPSGTKASHSSLIYVLQKVSKNTGLPDIHTYMYFWNSSSTEVETHSILYIFSLLVGTKYGEPWFVAIY